MQECKLSYQSHGVLGPNESSFIPSEKNLLSDQSSHWLPSTASPVIRSYQNQPSSALHYLCWHQKALTDVLQTLKRTQMPAQTTTPRKIYQSKQTEKEKYPMLKRNLRGIYLQSKLYRKQQNENFNLKRSTTPNNNSNNSNKPRNK